MWWLFTPQTDKYYLEYMALHFPIVFKKKVFQNIKNDIKVKTKWFSALP